MSGVTHYVINISKVIMSCTHSTVKSSAFKSTTMQFCDPLFESTRQEVRERRSAGVAGNVQKGSNQKFSRVEVMKMV